MATLHATEFTWSLKSKVSRSDVIAVVSVEKLTKEEIQDSWYYTAHFTFTTGEVIMGKCPKKIQVSTRAVQATAGFSALLIRPGDRFIAYLKKTDAGRFSLSGFSNQYLEPINSETKMVRDVGQTVNEVPLTDKLAELRSLAKARKPRKPNKAAMINPRPVPMLTPEANSTIIQSVTRAFGRG